METNCLLQIVSFCVSLLSLGVAVGTFISQRKTEKNTKPLMTQRTHEFLLKMQQFRILDSYIKLAVIKKILTEHDFLAYPSDAIMVSTKLPLDTIHTEMFYNTPMVYRDLRGLYEKTDQYNNCIDAVINHLKNPLIASEIVTNEIERLIVRNEHLCQDWNKFMMVAYGHGKNGKKTFVEEIVEKHKVTEQYNTCTNGEILAICNDNYHFINNIEDESKRNAVIDYINDHACQYYKNISQLVIPRK